MDMQNQASHGIHRRTHLAVSYSGALIFFYVMLHYHIDSERLHIAGHDTWIMPWMVPALMWTLHFLRRTYESMRVHRFGAGTLAWVKAPVPWMYYWGFALWIAYEVTGAGPQPPAWEFRVAGTLLFLCGEIGNAIAHVMLARLRHADGTRQGLPRGFLFEYVSCPHYFFEIVSWIGFCFVTATLSSLAFAAATTCILTVWATQRHRAYHRTFDGREGRELYPADRKVLVPFLY
ncbi:MAG: DUF1295 domain-containing protein [Ignavibacteriae bacterium]|nr:DUF1295 domain-containing protein [Ignavibacteriota bacterium]